MRRTLHSYFQESVQQGQQRPALHIGDKYFSYEELSRASRKISGFLRAKLPGGRQHCVGILCQKSLSAYAGLLGAMEGGNIYVPLNPKLPVKRLEYMANHAGISALIVDSHSVGKAAQLLKLLPGGLVVFLPDNEDVPAELREHTVFSQNVSDTEPSSPPSDAANYAYLLFTSGTTGTPKGVPVSHENACACIDGVCEHFQFFSSDRFTQFSELSFDVSIADLFLCWKAGACLYVPSFAEIMASIQFVAKHQLTVWSSVPTVATNLQALGSLKPDSLPSLRVTYFCGEALPVALTRQWQAAAPSSSIINFYGPTEAAIFSTFYVYDKLNPPPEGVMPLGAPLTGFQCRIAKEDLLAAGKTESGELLLSGPQVVAGYWNNEAATKKAFVQISDGEPGRVWYRTGDRVSMNDRNELLFHGRCDRQIKIRGNRVELDEVEAVLRRVTGVELVAVLPIFASDGRCEDLVAFCGANAGPEDEIKKRCSAFLPAYMLPRRIFQQEFPRNSSGKVDYVTLATRARELQAA